MARTQIQLPSDGQGKSVLAFDWTETGAPAPNAGVRNAQGLVLVDRNGNGINRPYGPARVSLEERQLFYDPFDGAVIDANRWTASGTNAPSQTLSSLTFATAVTASIWGKATSVPTFQPTIPGFLQASFALKLDNSGAAATGGSRFWGTGTSPGTPTVAAPLTDGIGFELRSDGILYAVVYNAGTLLYSQALSLAALGSSAPNTQFLDGAQHRYIVQIRTDRIFWFLENLDAPVATAIFQVPAIQTLPVLLQTVNPATGVPVGGYPLVVQGAVVADTAGLHAQVSDGTYPWRKAAISAAGAQMMGGQSSAAATVTNVAASATNVTLAAANANRKALMIYNAGTSNLHLKLGATATTTTSFSYMLAPGGLYELITNPIYTGAVDGIWAAVGGNGALITELV